MLFLRNNQDTAARRDYEWLIRDLTATNDDLHRQIGDLNASLETTTARMMQRNDELSTNNDELKKRNDEYMASNEGLSKRNSELSADIVATEKHVDDLKSEFLGATDTLKRRIEELESSNMILNSRNDELRTQLEQETTLRKATESKLSRLLYGNIDVGVSFHRTMLHLLHCCDKDVPDRTVHEAIFGQSSALGVSCLAPCLYNVICDDNYINIQIDGHRDELKGMPVVRQLLGSAVVDSTTVNSRGLTLDHLLAIRMYTFGNDDLQIFASINTPFYDANRKKENLMNQLPYVRLLIRSLRALGRTTGFETGITVYRGASIQNSRYLQQVRHDFINRTADNCLVPNTTLRFPSFASTSRTLETAMKDFGSDFVYVITLNHEVGLSYC
jgi:regulator of replication initiation timing